MLTVPKIETLTDDDRARFEGIEEEVLGTPGPTGFRKYQRLKNKFDAAQGKLSTNVRILAEMYERLMKEEQKVRYLVCAVACLTAAELATLGILFLKFTGRI